MQNSYVKWALIAAAFTIVLNLTTYIVNPDMLNGGVVSFVTFGVYIFCAVKAGLEERALNGGFMTWGQAFRPVFTCLAIYFTIVVIFDFILNTVIAPDLQEQRLEMAVELQEKMMEMFGQEMTDEQYEQIEKQSKASLLNTFMALIGSLICGALPLSAIIGLFIKRDNPQQDLL
jgi:hypothetical protein